MKSDEIPVRLAVPNDGIGLMHLIRMIVAENGFFPIAEEKVGGLIHAVLTKQQLNCPTIIGVIGKPDDIQATICLAVGSLWYTDEPSLGDLWNYVRPDCRKSTHAKSLLEFGKQCADRMNLKFMSGVVSTGRTEAKVRLYRRRFGTPTGAYFIYHPRKQVSEMKEAV